MIRQLSHGTPLCQTLSSRPFCALLSLRVKQHTTRVSDIFEKQAGNVIFLALVFKILE